MTDPRMSELFAQRPVTSDFARRRGVPYAVRRIITVIIFLALVVGVVLAFVVHRGSVSGEIPIIKAEGMYKQKPQEPGGIDIPHQDVQVYQEMDPKSAAVAQVEHLLPSAEEPLPSSANGANPSLNGSENKEFLIQAPAKAAAPPEQAPTPTPAPAAPVADVQTVTTPQTQTSAETASQRPGYMKIEQSVPAPTPDAGKVVQTSQKQPVVVNNESKKSGTAIKTVKIQLAALPDEEAAKTHAAHLQAKYTKQLGDVHLRLQKVDLGSKGIYFRIQSQPIAEDEANRVCSSLRSIKMSCILVR